MTARCSGHSETESAARRHKDVAQLIYTATFRSAGAAAACQEDER